MPGAFGGQLDHLELEFIDDHESPYEGWEPNPGPQQDRGVF